MDLILAHQAYLDSYWNWPLSTS